MHFNKKTTLKLSSIFILVIIGLTYYGCRKDSKTQTTTITDPVVAQAKSWYDAAYPQNSKTGDVLTTKTVNSVNNPAFDLSQHTGPDWQHPSKYVRFSKNVIEMPIDPATNTGFSIKNATVGREYANKAYTRSYYLLINNGKGYQAFLMTVIADSSYVKNDTSKLKNNTYRKHDADFSGLVLYFTPKGQYVSGYRYVNGQQVVPGTSTPTTNAVNSSSRGIKTNTEEEDICTDWYLITWYGDEIIDVQYEYSVCYSPGAGGGNSGGTTPPPCPTTTTPPPTGGGNGGLNAINQPVTYTEKAPGGPGSGGGDGGYPDPTTDPCTVVTPTINTDSLNNSCLKSQVNAALAVGLDTYTSDIANFVFGNNSYFDLNFYQSNALPNNLDGKTDCNGDFLKTNFFIANITLNANILPTSSKEYITITVMHETLHAYMTFSGILGEFNQHTDMANNYITSMQNDLQAMFPTMSATDAQALAWGGLADTQAWQNLLTSNPTLANSIIDINNQYRNATGTKGQRCN